MWIEQVDHCILKPPNSFLRARTICPLLSVSKVFPTRLGNLPRDLQGHDYKKPGDGGHDSPVDDMTVLPPYREKARTQI